MAFCILRTEKIKTMGNMAGASDHNFRERETLNADPSLTPSNTHKGAKSTAELLDAVKDRLLTVPTVRKNAVIGLDYFVGASPEWFDTASKKDQESYFDAAEKWLIKRHGVENIMTMTRHYDEKSPHLAALVLPIDPKGKLNCSFFQDGKKTLSAMQTDFAEKVGAKFGLERGIEGSAAEHTKIKDFYKALNTPAPALTKIPAVKAPTFSERAAEKMGLETDHSRAIDARDAAQKKRNLEFAALRKTEQSKAKLYDLSKDANEARDKALRELRTNAVQLRSLPLKDVLERLGCELDKSDKNNWKTPVGRLTLQSDSVKFFAQELGKGGGGAIDLVMCVNDCDYKSAVQWLATSFGTGKTIEDMTTSIKSTVEEIAKLPKPLYVAPQPEPTNWPSVRKYLTEIRKISAQIIDNFHETKKVYADKFKNCVFVLGNNRGVELRGTSDAPFHGVRGEKQPFGIKASDKKSVVFVESAIDAISFFELKKSEFGLILSTSGASGQMCKTTAAAYRQRGFEIVAAFDNDKAGDAMSVHLGQPAERLLPVLKDWNADLIESKSTSSEKREIVLSKTSSLKM